MTRERISLSEHWRFYKHSMEDQSPFRGERLDLDDRSWEQVKVPHDWAIAGPFDADNDVQVNSVIEDGITNKMVHIGRTGALPIVGIGWYRYELSVPFGWVGKRVLIEFDGVMSDSTVYLNEQEVGSWPYGYTSFCFDLTERLRFGQTNVLAVRVCSLPSSSRWYPGAGIYRHVRLIVTGPIHVGPWGTYITTPHISDQSAQIRVVTTLVNALLQPKLVELKTILIDPNGRVCGEATSELEFTDRTECEQLVAVTEPALWDVAAPQLYKAVTIVSVLGLEVDRYETPFGIRSIAFDAQEGFKLNGTAMKLKGVCLHHDLGALGAAVYVRAIERQLELMQKMGCNAIRATHNPPAPELLDLCDRMGLLVIDEAFDEWAEGKVTNGYHRLFKEWAEKDLRAMICRDRNHPSVIMWSTGNEIREQWMEDGAEVARYLTNICHDADPTRPVTAGLSMTDEAIRNGLADAVDIPGWNYKPHRYAEYHEQRPDWIAYGSETASTVSSRGVYHFPAAEEIPMKRQKDLHASSYDLSAPRWGSTPDREFMAQDELPYMLGEFVWTGFDYLGEPTPYRTEWPSRSSYFGIMDLCGLPKDRYYLYKSQWSMEPVLHLLPHWNWPGREGEYIPVHCYTSYSQAELFLNGISLGVSRKSTDSLYERYRLRWEKVPYEPGTIRVVAYDNDGNEAMSHEVHTAGAPARILLEPDRSGIQADGHDLSFITVSIVDERGRRCPTASEKVSFTIQGAGELAAIDNGDPTSTTSFRSDSICTFSGQCMVIVRSLAGQPGTLRITAASGALQAATADIAAVPPAEAGIGELDSRSS
ncbi:beta-galactosidase GalB [Paenibacillus ferrarius]|uniref:beta-galactosidase GalB n=1 Tax=Paenibacillus ferrarius TaxID=1469647 RepID=UPI003D2BAB39